MQGHFQRCRHIRSAVGNYKTDFREFKKRYFEQRILNDNNCCMQTAQRFTLKHIGHAHGRPSMLSVNHWKYPCSNMLISLNGRELNDASSITRRAEALMWCTRCEKNLHKNRKRLIASKTLGRYNKVRFGEPRPLCRELPFPGISLSFTLSTFVYATFIQLWQRNEK